MNASNEGKAETVQAAAFPSKGDQLLQHLEQRSPNHPWREPLEITGIGQHHNKLCCRVCIAKYGLVNRHLGRREFLNRADFDAHMAEHAA